MDSGNYLGDPGLTITEALGRGCYRLNCAPHQKKRDMLEDTERWRQKSG